MTELLHIATSPREATSHSRQAAEQLIQSVKSRIPELNIVLRDLTKTSVPHVSNSFVNASLIAVSQRNRAHHLALTFSEALINELDAADAVLLSLPLHNFTVPSVLKSWIDHVVRPGRTFQSTSNGKVGLLRNRPVCILLACGGTTGSHASQQNDWATPYLHQIFQTIGLQNFQSFTLENCNRSSEARIESYTRFEKWLATQSWPC